MNKVNYKEWLESTKWNYYFTGTTHYTLTIKSARRLAERFHKVIKTHDPKAYMFWVGEKYGMKDGQHIHGLLYTQLGFHRIKYLWGIAVGGRINSEKNGTARIGISRFKKSAGASTYCLKTIDNINDNYDFLI